MVYVLVFQDRVRDREMYDEYVKHVHPILEKYQGKIIAIDQVATPLEGSLAPKTVIMASFPSAVQVFAWYDSAEYRQIVELRHQSVKTEILLIHGLPENAGAVGA